MRGMTLTAWLIVAVGLVGCERKPDGGSAKTPPAGTTAGADHGHAHAEPAPADDGHHGGPVIELGSAEVAGMTVRASRDAGEIRAGGDAPVDVWIDDGVGPAAVVRFWIGTEDAKGAIKAKAEIENGKWHTHTEIPDPLPADARLWVEIEDKDGATHVVSFELKG